MRESQDDQELREPLIDEQGTRETKKTMQRNVPAWLLSPWENYWLHGRIPWNLLCHVLLMVCGTLQILLYDNQNSAYVRASYRNWAYFFLPSGPTIASSLDATFEEYIYTVNDTIQAITHVRDAYFSIKEVSVATYEYHYDNSMPAAVAPILMTVTQYKNRSIMESKYYNLTQKSLGPFDSLNSTSQALAYLHSIVSMDFSFPLRDIDYGPFYFDCFDWVIQLKMEMVENSHLRMRIADCALDVCSVNDIWATLRGRFLWLNVIVVIIGVIYLILIVKSIIRDLTRVSRARSRPSWGNVPLDLKLRVLNPHHFPIGASLLLVLYNALWNISSVVVHVPLSFWHRFLEAIGPLMLWMTFVTYLEHNTRFYSIVLTLRASIPKVLAFLAGVSPIFLGYAIFGSIVFGYRVNGFGGIQQSCVTLFAVLNGDVILDTFGSLAHDFPFLGAAYIYSFVALFIYVVLNIFIAIVEEAFFSTRSTTRALDLLSQNMFPKPQEIATRELLATLEQN